MTSPIPRVLRDVVSRAMRRPSKGCPLLPCGSKVSPGEESSEARRPTRGSVSPVAPRRTAVAAVVRPADHSLPYAVLHVVEDSYQVTMRPQSQDVKHSKTVLTGHAEEGTVALVVSALTGLMR